MSPNWPGMTGDRTLVRIGTRAADDGTCPDLLAAKAFPDVRPAQRSYARRQVLSDFPLGAVMDALDDVEFRGRSREEAVERIGQAGRPRLHPGAIRWAGHATAAYLDGVARADTPATVPVPHFWVVQRISGQRTWELYAWGRRYQSPDGSIRELRLIRFGQADEDGRDPAQVAIAAYAVAFGLAAPWPTPWWEPFRPVQEEPAEVQRVRVVELGLEDGSYVPLFKGTVSEAGTLYADQAREQVKEITLGGVAEPGYACADCKLGSACEAVRRIPGLLAITDPTAPRRTWSVSDGRYFRECPAQDHLRRLHLPKRNEYGESAVRGQAVHAWLEESHRGPVYRACTERDVPPRADDWSAGKWHVVGEQAVLGARMLASHAELCAFHRRDHISRVRLEPTLAFHDTTANVIVIAKPDMLYLEDGAWVWREVKTRTRLPRSTADLFQDVPQLALATVLLAENALGGKPTGMRVELELLAADVGDVLLIDPSDPAEVTRARQAVHDLAAPWHADQTAQARPGPHCRNCPVSRWCPDAQTGDAA